MHTLEIRATVTGPDGFYYREAHEWRNMNDLGIAWFDAALKELFTLAQELASKGKGDHVAEFVQIRNGEAVASVVSGLSYKDIVKFQRAFARKEAELLDIADAR